MSKLNFLTYQPKYQDRFFFDNNIWMYIFCPLTGTNQKKFIDGYSDFLGKILDAGSTIFVSSLILSEFYNAYIKLDYNRVKGNNFEFKYKRDYRPSKRFSDTHEEIINTIESRILGIAKRIDDNFTKINIEELRDESNTMDFNDSYYMELQRFHPSILVTNDSDLLKTKKDIQIISML